VQHEQQWILDVDLHQVFEYYQDEVDAQKGNQLMLDLDHPLLVIS
jgi:hypothetical protein